MRNYLIGILSLMVFGPVFGQAEAEIAENIDGDTTIYTVVEEMPRFPVCEGLDTTLAFKNACAQQQLLIFISQNIFYPLEARENGYEGTVVVNFIVEKDGTLSNSNVVRDIGGGCGDEALRVVNAMNDAAIRWVPGKREGKSVRVSFNLPVRFKLEEAPDFIMVGQDSVWVTIDEPLEFEGGVDSLSNFLMSKLKYPDSAKDSCFIGRIDAQLLVQADGLVRVLNMTDYNGLGFDFWYEATNAVTSTYGKWKPAVRKERNVSSTYDINMFFAPEDGSCKTEIDQYNKAQQLVQEGLNMYNEDKKEEGIAKMTEGIKLFPKDADLLATRGQAYMNMNKFEEACADFKEAKAIGDLTMFDNLIPILCK